MTEKNFNTALLRGSVCYAVTFTSVAKALCVTVKLKSEYYLIGVMFVASSLDVYQWNQESAWRKLDVSLKPLMLNCSIVFT